MTEDYLDNQYRLTLTDLKLSKTEAERAEALKTLKRIVDTATELYGFDFADKLMRER